MQGHDSMPWLGNDSLQMRLVDLYNGSTDGHLCDVGFDELHNFALLVVEYLVDLVRFDLHNYVWADPLDIILLIMSPLHFLRLKHRLIKCLYLFAL